MRYQELLFSTSVLGAAIASHNCRHPGNMRFGPSIFQPETLPQSNGPTTRTAAVPDEESPSQTRPSTDHLLRPQIRTLLDAVGASHLCHLRTHQQSVSLFDHLVGDGEQPGRHLDEFIISTRIYYRPRCLTPKSALHSRGLFQQYRSIADLPPSIP